MLNLCRNIILKVPMLLALMMLVHPINGQSLSEYLGLLKKNNILLDQSKNQIRASQTDSRLTKAAMLPTIGADFNYQRDFTQSFIFINGEEAAFFGDRFRANFNNNLNLDVIASQSLFAPSVKANYQLAVLAEEHAQLTYDDLTKGLISQASQLFWQAVFTRESLKVLEENQQLAQAQWQQMKDLAEEGYASELQVLQTESYYKRTIPQLESARNSYQMLLNELKVLANMPLEDPLYLKGEITIQDTALPSYSLVNTNLANNPQLKILQQQLSIADQQIEASKAVKSPVISANLGYNFIAQNDDFTFDNSIHLLYGRIGVQIPIYSGGVIKAHIQKDKIYWETTQLEIQQKKLTLQKELQNAILNYQTALQKIEEEKAAITLTERELEIATEGIKEGVVTPLEWKEIRLQLTASKLRLLNVHLDLRIARLQIERVLGM